jgi:tryptophan synthase beta chain
MHAASIAGGRPACCTATRTYLLMDARRPDRGGPFDLRRPRLSRHRPEHALAQRHGRVKFLSRPTRGARRAFQLCRKLEGIIPALEPAHALARVRDIAPQKPKIT